MTTVVRPSVPKSVLPEPYVDSYSAKCAVCKTEVWLSKSSGRPGLYAEELILCYDPDNDECCFAKYVTGQNI